MNIRKIISIFLVFFILLSYMQKIVKAVEINSAYIETLGDCGQHLQFMDSKTGTWGFVKTEMAGYRENGTVHYAYCLNIDKNGVGEVGNYTVNVQQLISDVAIWRAIINGFPYKSASDLGVYNDQDAFVATKQAVYSVLYNRDVDSYYRGGDDRGARIFNAIKTIVNKARNGSETPAVNNLINANKIGEFKKETEDYYSQEYSISSSTELSNYSITSINNFPDGSYIANVNNNPQNEFLSNEHFKILVPKKNILNDFEGEINLKGNVKTYPVFIGESPNEGWQNYALTYYAFTDAIDQTKLLVKTNKSNLKIIKTDSETNKALKGVEFNIKYENGEYIGKYNTNEKGIIELNDLKPGRIIATETKTLDEYVLDNKNNEINLEYDSSSTLNIKNEHKKGNLKIYKVDSNNKKIALGGVKFDLYSYEFNKVMGSYTTDVNGEIYIDNLRTGNWALIEKKTNKWYNLANSVDIKVEWNVLNSTTIENELKKGQIKVSKVDKDNHEIKIPNVTFKVMDESGNVLEKIITNKDGEAITSSYPVRDYQKLLLKEVSTNQNYELDESIHIVELKENEISNIQIENKKKSVTTVVKKLPKTGC